MFIKGIVVPILIICLVLFWGVNLTTGDGNYNNSTSIYGGIDGTNNNNTMDSEERNGRTYGSGYDSINDGMVPDSLTNGLNGNNGLNSRNINTNGLNGTNNNNSNNNNLNNSGTIQDSLSKKIQNEVQRINGIANANVLINDNVCYVAIDLNDNSLTSTNTIREQVRQAIDTNTTTVSKACIVFDETLYNNFSNNNDINSFRNYYNDSNVIVVNR